MLVIFEAPMNYRPNSDHAKRCLVLSGEHLVDPIADRHYIIEQLKKNVGGKVDIIIDERALWNSASIMAPQQGTDVVYTNAFVNNVISKTYQWLRERSFEYDVVIRVGRHIVGERKHDDTYGPGGLLPIKCGFLSEVTYTFTRSRYDAVPYPSQFLEIKNRSTALLKRLTDDNEEK